MKLDFAARWLIEKEQRKERKLARTAQQKRGLAYSRALRRNETRAERVLRLALTDAGYFFKAQPIFFSPDTLYIPDFILKLDGQKLVIEVDGPSHLANREYDAQRTEWMRSNRQCAVIRFTNEQVLTQLDVVLLAIAAFNPKMRNRSYRRTMQIGGSQKAESYNPAEQFQRFSNII